LDPQNIPEPLLINPGFEQGLTGWHSAGRLEEGGRNNGSRLTHDAGKLETTQLLANVRAGWYILKAWVRSSGGQKEAYIALQDGDRVERGAVVPIAPADRWLQIVVSAKISGEGCSIRLVSDAGEGDWVSFDDVEMVPGHAALSIRGADISSLYKSEMLGGVYKDESGSPRDALEILREHGLNYARMRVWLNSPDGCHGKDQLLAMAKRLHEKDIRLLVDFHYSDSWADPGKQFKPAAWETLDFEELKKALYDHTFDICSSLNGQGTPPHMVQVGNEISNGMLWPDGKNDENFNNLTALLKEGCRAVKECSPSTLVMFHLDNGGNNKMYRWWFDNILAQGAAFDLIGVSYYPYWHGTLADLQANLNDIALRYNKDLVVVETSYAFTREDHDNYENIIRTEEQPGYPFTPTGQARMLGDIMSIVRAVPQGRGAGVMWWDATWTAVPGNGWDPFHPDLGNNWENQALFDFENRALPALGLFSNP
jgi:arabinogalactan endo-1,4-beta-galactosidase